MHRPDGDFDQDKSSKIMAKIAARRGIPLIDLLPILRQAQKSGDGPFFCPFDGHWTASGHEAAARAIEARLRALDLLPR